MIEAGPAVDDDDRRPLAYDPVVERGPSDIQMAFTYLDERTLLLRRLEP